MAESNRIELYVEDDAGAWIPRKSLGSRKREKSQIPQGEPWSMPGLIFRPAFHHQLRSHIRQVSGLISSSRDNWKEVGG